MACDSTSDGPPQTGAFNMPEPEMMRYTSNNRNNSGVNSEECDSAKDELEPKSSRHSEIEKRRRDKMNTYILKLAEMVPMCSAVNRKLDKLTVLRMAVQHMKSIKSNHNLYTEVSHKPAFLSDDEMNQLTLAAADGFLFVVGCEWGKILYASTSVKDVLNYTQNDFIGRSLFDILHAKDIQKVKEQLTSSDICPRERLIDAKTMMPVSTELPHRPTQLCSGARRSFFCRMKIVPTEDISSGIKFLKDNNAMAQRKKKTDKKKYLTIQCTGYLKSSPSSKHNWDVDATEHSSLSCLVAIGRVARRYDPRTQTERTLTKTRPVEFISRHNIDGIFLYIEQSSIVILGYVAHELIGTSLYDYLHPSDVKLVADVQQKVISTEEKIETASYRFRSRDGTFIVLKSFIHSFKNPTTKDKDVDFIIFKNKVLPPSNFITPQETGFESCETVSMDGERSQTNFSQTSRGSCDVRARTDFQWSTHERLELQKLAASPEYNESANRMAYKSSLNSKVSSTQPYLDKETVDYVTKPLPWLSSHPTTVARTTTYQNNPSSVFQPPEISDEVHSTRDQQSGITQDTSLQSFTELESARFVDQTVDDGDAAMAFIMSLLEADGGLGGPVDYTDLPWPLCNI